MTSFQPGVSHCSFTLSLKRLVAAIIASVTIWSSPTALAGGFTLLVPQHHATISEALSFAGPGDTVLVAAGTYNESIFPFSDVTLKSASGPNVTTIDATGLDMPVIELWGTGPNMRIEGFTIRGGSHLPPTFAAGGGISAQNAMATFVNCIIRDNEAESGGGVSLSFNSNITFEDCSFISNVATSQGGGVIINSATGTFTNCVFQTNTSTDGGGGLNVNSQGNATLTGCSFTGNVDACCGGGALVFHSASFTDCTFTSNSGSSGGGIAFLGTPNGSITNCTFDDNTASSNFIQSGGGLLASGNGTIIVSGCEFLNGNAEYGAGAQFHAFNGSGTITNCSFTNNDADAFGGGLAISSSSGTSVWSSTFTGNDATIGGGGLYVNASTTTVRTSNFENNSGQGGAVNANNNANVTLRSSNFTGNVGNFGGAIYYAATGQVTLISCYVANNIASQGGGVYGANLIDPLVMRSNVTCGNSPNNFSVSTIEDQGGNLSQVTCVPHTPANDTPRNPNPADPGSTFYWSFFGASASGTSTCDPDTVDVFYEFEIVDGPQTITIDTCDSDVATALAVFDADEIACSVTCDDEKLCDQEGASCITLRDLANGVYLVRVSLPGSAIDGVSPGTLGFALRVEVVPTSNCPADIAPNKGDGSVGVPDLLAIINAWGPCADPPALCPADIAPNGGDGGVGVPDLLAIINAWGPCP